jgi:hypothetical protein
MLSSVAATASFARLGPATTLSPGLTVADLGSSTLASATVAITGGEDAGDVLSANTTGTSITASYNSTTETLTLSGTDTLADYQAVLQTVSFNSTNQNPTNFGFDPSRTITWVINDGSTYFNLSTAATTTLGITGGLVAPLAAGTTADMIMRDPTGVYAIFDIGDNSFLAAGALGQVGLEWQVAGLGGFNGTDTSDMILRNSNTGAFEVYDISNNAITSAASMGQVGLEWTVVGFGDFSSNPGETDMLMQNSNTGAFEVFDISNNKITSASSIGELTPTLGYQVAGLGDFSSNPGETDMLLRNSSTGVFAVLDISNNAFTPTPTIANTIGQVGLEWTVAGFGDFSGNANETDMLMRNSNTGHFEVFDISHNVITFAAAMGQVGLEWTVAGFGDFSGNANEADMLMRNSNTGAFEVFDISHNAITLAASMGQVGLEWQVGGIAAASSAGSIPLLEQAMASVGASAAVSSTTGAILSGAHTSQHPLVAIPH